MPSSSETEIEKTYHGTSAENKDKILTENYTINKQGFHELGTGVYFYCNSDCASKFAGKKFNSQKTATLSSEILSEGVFLDIKSISFKLISDRIKELFAEKPETLAKYRKFLKEKLGSKTIPEDDFLENIPYLLDFIKENDVVIYDGAFFETTEPILPGAVEEHEYKVICVKDLKNIQNTKEFK